jgi:hypothetical protein
VYATLEIGVKSRTVSYGRVVNSVGLVVRFPDEIINSVYPSGGALATTSAPMIPLAPGRLSTMTG